MKKIVLIALLCMMSIGASAQLVSSTSSMRIKRKAADRAEWSYGVSAIAAKGFKEIEYDFSGGLWLDGGYYFTSQFYAGASLGLQYCDVADYYGGAYSSVKFLLGVRYLFSPEENTLFADLRAGVNVANPFRDYGRYELGIGYMLHNHFEITIGIENERWDALDGPEYLTQVNGAFVRLGYRFR